MYQSWAKQTAGLAGVLWWDFGSETERTNAMTFEIFAFFAVAASLVMIGFASGPAVVRRVNSSGYRRSHFH